MGGMEAEHGRRFDVDQMPTQIGEVFEEDLFLRKQLDPAVRAQMDGAITDGASQDRLIELFGEEQTEAYFSSPYAGEAR